MHPARQADGFTNVALSKVGAAVGAIGVHVLSFVIPVEAGIYIFFDWFTSFAGMTAGMSRGRASSLLVTFCQPARAGLWASYNHAYPSVDYQVGRPQSPGRPPLETAIRRRGHRVHAREYLLAGPVPDPGREHRRSSGNRSQG